MSLDLTVETKISASPQAVRDQDGDPTALALATHSAVITGQDIPGEALPLSVEGIDVSNTDSLGRLLRLRHVELGRQGIYDFAIDASGNLHLYVGGGSIEALMVSPEAVVTIKNLSIDNLTVQNLNVTQHLSAG